MRIYWEYLFLLLSLVPYALVFHYGISPSMHRLNQMLPTKLQVPEYIALKNGSFVNSSVPVCNSTIPTLWWNSLAAHQAKYNCLCMHHLNVSNPCRACLIGTLHMVNPVLKGASVKMGRFRQGGVITERPLAVVVEWRDPRVGAEFLGRMDKAHAACLHKVVQEEF